jgi:16S rRNA (guanine966-N2)-methyltransferase
MKNNNMNEIRIIGGKWRSQKITFVDSEGLRPTLDRVRETLFNWLQFSIENKSVLDAFSGSGALGYEALSRGAKQVDFVELDKHAAQNITKNLIKRGVSSSCVHNNDVIEYLNTTENTYDLVFLDPPFYQNLLQPCVERIHSRLSSNALIYVEIESNANISFIPIHWKCLKRKDGKLFSYMLFENAIDINE